MIKYVSVFCYLGSITMESIITEVSLDFDRGGITKELSRGGRKQKRRGGK
jgi:hypothetical protein